MAMNIRILENEFLLRLYLVRSLSLSLSLSLFNTILFVHIFLMMIIAASAWHTRTGT